jgi:hypothetical protein
VYKRQVKGNERVFLERFELLGFEGAVEKKQRNPRDNHR